MNDGVLIRQARPEELHTLWQTAYSDLQWKEFDGPYFPFKVPSLAKFKTPALLG
ncbi:hypothetical protein R6242_17100 [Iodobacter sp. CM08]|uniref:hypothetical protein n=1 Tax=Iodobacter sp. CM08 TaxID=3085902 RepID=UPI0029827576|nr:hypothetical protein [Iodobacter sp. CM08]MDW5418286.1 hypothetical protein [Iodobacter sp. CM08]